MMEINIMMHRQGMEKLPLAEPAWDLADVRHFLGCSGKRRA
jgi:hypothetical protein